MFLHKIMGLTEGEMSKAVVGADKDGQDLNIDVAIEELKEIEKKVAKGKLSKSEGNKLFENTIGEANKSKKKPKKIIIVVKLIVERLYCVMQKIQIVSWTKRPDIEPVEISIMNSLDFR